MARRKMAPPKQSMELLEACCRLEESRRQGAKPAALRIEWDRLWRRYVESDDAADTNIEDIAALIANGWSLAMDARDYREALRLLQIFFSDPRIEDAGAVTTTVLGCDRAITLLYIGDDDQATDTFRTLLSSTDRKVARIGRLIARNHLYAYCGDQPGDDRASGTVAGLARDVLRALRCRSVVWHSVSTDVTYAQLRRVLASTYPPPHQQPI